MEGRELDRDAARAQDGRLERGHRRERPADPVVGLVAHGGEQAQVAQVEARALGLIPGVLLHRGVGSRRIGSLACGSLGCGRIGRRGIQRRVGRGVGRRIPDGHLARRVDRVNGVRRIRRTRRIRGIRFAFVHGFGGFGRAFSRRVNGLGGRFATCRRNVARRQIVIRRRRAVGGGRIAFALLRDGLRDARVVRRIVGPRRHGCRQHAPDKQAGRRSSRNNTCGRRQADLAIPHDGLLAPSVFTRERRVLYNATIHRRAVIA